MPRAFLVVHGVVQGVGYRAFVAQNANRLSVKGFVRNAKDGSVVILAEASDTVLMSFIESIKFDMGHAHQVFGVEFKNERLKEFEGRSFSGFEIMREKSY